ncbi:MAG: glycosyltransferase [Planctomycetota bacterium]
MDRIRTAIDGEALRSGGGAPRVAMLMTTFRHGAFVGEALRAALAQTWSALDIVVSDDCSDDQTWSIVTDIAGRYTGPHRLVLMRHGQNGGAAKNLLAAMERTDAALLLLAHGDDISMPNRVQRVAETWIATGASLISHQAISGPDPAEAQPFAAEGSRSGPVSLAALCRHSWTPHMLGATFGFERRIFDEFGPFDRARLPRGGDHVLPTRAALLGGFYYLHEPLMFWRRHPGQMTHHTADFAGGGLSHAETWKAYDLNALLYRLDEIRGFAGRHGSTPLLAQAERTLIATIAKHVRDWSVARGALESQGQTLRFERRQQQVQGAGA